MPRKKRAQLGTFSESLETLFPSCSAHQAEKLRASFHAHLEAQNGIVKLLRNSTPEADNSDGRNLLQALAENLLTHLSELSTNVEILANRHIKEYKVVRAEKHRKRKSAVKAAKAVRRAERRLRGRSTNLQVQEFADHLEEQLSELDKALAQQLTQLLKRNTDAMEALFKQRGEARVDGLTMPQFHGRVGESVEFYFDQVVQYLQAKNIDYKDPVQNTRILAMVASNLKHNDHSWYRIHKESITNVDGLIGGLTREFVPPDLQERLRDHLYSLHQRKRPSLEDYISRFRNAIMQVKDMSELDKITYFICGLISPTKEEVQYRL